MRTNYFFKHLLIVVALFGSFAVFAQTEPKVPVFTEVFPVRNGAGPDTTIMFAYEAAAAWGDYNNDGYLDLIIAGATHASNGGVATVLYKNMGDGTFEKVAEHPFPNVKQGTFTWFDYNNDGNLDLFVAGKIPGPEGDVAFSGLFQNYGAESNFEFEEVFAGTFQYVHNGGGNRANRYAPAADFDNDGWTDLYLQGDTDGRHSILYRNVRGTGFEKVENPVNGEKPFIQLNAGGAAWGDYDNDGYLDLLVSGYAADAKDIYPEVGGYCGALYRNNGDGTFAEPFLYKGTEEGGVAWIDYNNDGWLDFIAIGVGNNGDWYWPREVYVNDKNGGFNAFSIESFPQGRQENAFDWGDVNNDGFVDALYLHAAPNALFLNNNGDQTFFRYDFVLNNGTTDDQRGGSASLADYDRDNDLDALTVGYSNTDGRESILMRNDLGEGIPVNQAPSVPANLAATAEAEEGVMTFTWDLSTDDITPQKAITYNLYIQREGRDEIYFVLPADAESGLLKVNETLAPITGNFYTIKGLVNGEKYTLGVQAIDNAKVSSKFATREFTAGTSTSISSIKSESIKVIAGKGNITISSSKDLNGKVQVYNVSGMNVYTSNQVNTTVGLPAGVYIVKVASGADSTIEKVLVK